LGYLSFPNNLVLIEGGLPLSLNSEVIGSIGVSGVQSSQDGEIAAAGAAAL
jgi:glc operon protein GlcG